MIGLLAAPPSGRHASELDRLVGRYGFTYPAGRVIVQQEDVSTDLYVVLSGSVAFIARDEASGERWLGVGGSGTVFGEVAAFCGLPRSATVRAIEETLALRLPQAAATELVQASPNFALQLIQMLAGRLRAATLCAPATRTVEPEPARQRHRSVREAAARYSAVA